MTREQCESELKNYVYLKLKGDYMEPEFQDGDVLHVCPGAPVKDGDYIIASRDGNNPGLLGQYVDKGEWGAWLKDTNPGTQVSMEEKGFTVFGRVMQYTRYYK